MPRGREILEAIDELAAEAPVAKRKLTLEPSQRNRAVEMLRLRLIPERADLRVMNISRNDNAVTIE